MVLHGRGYSLCRAVEGQSIMRRWRRTYYDSFAPFYDGFIALHSGDKTDAARRFLAALVPVGRSGVVLDLW